MGRYPLPVTHFMVDWGGSRIGFTEVSGLSAELEVVEYREGSSPENIVLKMPGLKKFSNITLKRGVIKGDNDFFQWFNTAALNQVEKRNIVISLLDEAHQPVRVWRVQNAWPVKIESSDLKADGNEVAVESLELAHEGFTIEMP